MARALITGMSGAGKSTVLEAVARRGYPIVDTDYDGWHVSGASWDEHRMSALLAMHSTIAVSGTSPAAADNRGSRVARRKSRSAEALAGRERRLHWT